jgi:hypothetical protein
MTTRPASGIRTPLLVLLFIWLLGAMAAALPAQDAESKTVIVEGVASAIDNMRARDDAINDAYRQAVSEAAGVFVDAATMTRESELIGDKILTRAAGYVKSRRILDEGEEDGIYRVRLECEVVMGALKDDLIALEILKSRLGLPRVMVIGDERADGDPLLSRSSATEIEALLIDRGFDLVAKDFIDLRKARDIVLSNSDAEAAAFGQEMGAEVVITYTASADYEGAGMTYGMRLEKYRASITVRAVKVDTGAMMAAASGVELGSAEGRTTAARKALENVGRVIAPELFAKVRDAWMKDAEGGTRLELVVTGIDFQTANLIYQDLQELRGVTDVGQPQMARGVFTYRLTGSLQGFGLAQRVSDNFGLVITEVTQNRVKAEAPPAEE